MIGWRHSTWGDEISLEYGKAIRGYKDSQGPVRVFGSNGPIGWTDTALAQGPGVILGRKGAYRGVNYSHAPFFVIDTAYYVKSKTDLDMRWLYYAVIYHKLGEIDDGSPIPSTTRAAVYVEDVEIPPLPEQREIAAILGALDDKIEVNRKASATLEKMARALYRSWFVDFDPVHARAQGRPPAHMDPETAALFPDSFGDNGLPEGWSLTTIGDVADIAGGATPSTKQPDFWEDGQHLWATPKDLSTLSGPVLLDTDRQITDLGLAKISSGLFPAGSLLLSSRAPIGYLAIAQRPVAVNQGFIGIRETPEVSGVEAFHWCLENMDLIHANANGSTFQEIAKKNFRPLPYVLATQEVRDAFNTQAGQYFARIAAFTEENQTLAALRDALLPRLMSGELRVGAARELVEEVV